MENGPELSCNHCGRVYSRLEHLQRHLVSYSSRSSHQCLYCLRQFKRKDVLSRHSRTCSGRSTTSTTTCDERACHGCAKKKRKCSRARPSCLECRRAGIPCRYPKQGGANMGESGVADAETSQQAIAASSMSSLILPTDVDEDLAMLTSSVSMETSTKLGSGIIQSVQGSPLTGVSLQIYLPSTLPSRGFSFLFSFTAQYGLRNCFGLPSGPQVRKLDVQTCPSYDAVDVGRTTTSPGLLPKAAPSPTLETSGFGALEGVLTHGLSPLIPGRKPGGNTCRNLEAELRATLRLRGRSINWFCSELFTPILASSALDLYWSHWHPNWPVIHKPTFRTETAPLALLAAMVIVGSCYSDLIDARGWFDTVEDVAFDELDSLPQSASLHKKVQIIQAAYLACIFQTWDGGSRARTRIRRHRFSLIVNAVRDLDMSRVRHDDLAVQLGHFAWIEFIRMEECIRTLLWVFLLDSAHVIFNNVPPQFALRELSVGLASPEMSFQAASAHECFRILQAWLAYNPRPFDMTLYGLVNSFFRPKLSDVMLDRLAHASFMNLWCVTSAFHVVLFNLDPLLGGEQQLIGLQTGIDNWESVWNRRMMNNDERFFDSIVSTADFTEVHNNINESWQYPGFWKNAAEYWLLARVMLQRMAAAHRSAAAADELSGCMSIHVNVSPHLRDRIEDADMHSLHAFLTSLGTAHSF